MALKHVGIRELKSTLSECVREVKSGETIVVTEHGRPVARIIPDSNVSLEERMHALVKSGVISWSGRRFVPGKPVGRLKGKRRLSDIISENRV